MYLYFFSTVSVCLHIKQVAQNREGLKRDIALGFLNPAEHSWVFRKEVCRLLNMYQTFGNKK
ncbi:uncharacterized protein ASCRUDRAFT_81940 [Ascoidea rubescens DSM 1968]|uniref:Uncharacterized protein n=1 Tax=Ascoidea rubescens DSM 1968 TaxID=1344418 RepID=A0A1D2VDX2_9ASCO|nr:hypothetical protein ASCRUDRAFT_81940 [Ascoidea rubescens DSM 1968]ODV59667.1 hypothetical protein ASCRUDRAFT_81940 [Ascoidea rubescens DSM 1968]